MLGNTWQRKSDEELIAASAHLSEYTSEAEELIRLELRRRAMPEPPQTVRAEQSNPSGKSRTALIAGLMVVGLVIGGALYIVFGHGEADDDADYIYDHMRKPLAVELEKHVTSGTLNPALMRAAEGIMLEETLVRTAPDKRKPEHLKLARDLVKQEWYNSLLAQKLQAADYQRLKELRAKYRYAEQP